MNILFDSDTSHSNLHHAYILEGEREEMRQNLLNFIEKKLKHSTQANPDFWHRQFETFSIDDARELRDIQSRKAFNEESKKIFVIETIGMTIEAQNSLLKIFEEPTSGTHFFIIVPNAEVFLPTLKSRVIIISQIPQDQKKSGDAKKFLQLSIKDRLEFVSEIIEEKNKEQAILLVDNLIRILHSRHFQNMFILEELLKCRAYLSDRSPSLKLILEHIVLITPISFN